MKSTKATALALVAFLILSSLSAMFLATAPNLVHAQVSEERVLYEENFDDDEAQGWELDDGWDVGHGILVRSATGYPWARYTWDIPSADYGRVIFSFWLVNLLGNMKANVRMSDSASYAIGLSYPGEGLLSLSLFKEHSTNGFYTYTSTLLAENATD